MPAVSSGASGPNTSTGTAYNDVLNYRTNFQLPDVGTDMTPFDIAWNNLDPNLQQEWYNAMQTKYGIPVSSLQAMQQQYQLTGPRRTPYRAYLNMAYAKGGQIPPVRNSNPFAARVA